MNPKHQCVGDEPQTPHPASGLQTKVNVLCSWGCPYPYGWNPHSTCKKYVVVFY